MKKIICPVCKKTTWVEFLRLRDFTLWKCRRCGLVRKDFESEKDMQFNWYNEKYFSYLEERDNRKKFLSWHAGKFKLIKKFKKRGNFLDVGCGLGLGVEIAIKEGFNVWATDISPFAGKWTQQRFNVPVFIGQVRDAPFNHNSFDVIYLHHVLEHVLEPDSFLEDLKIFLKNKGILVISVPNIASVYFKIYGNRFHIFQREHLWYFSLFTIKQLLTNCGFNLLMWRTGLTRDTKEGWISVGIENILGSDTITRKPTAFLRKVWRFLPLNLREKVFKIIHSVINFLFVNIRVSDELIVIANLKK